MAGQPDVYEFGPFLVDILKRELHNAGEPVEVGKLVFNLLAFLVTNYRQAISNQEASASLWPNQEHTDQKLKDLFGRLCTTLDDEDRAHPKYLSRVKGYLRWVTEVTERPRTSGVQSRQTKVLYVKVVHLRQKGRDQPAYSVCPHPEKARVEVFDEAMYYSLHMFADEQKSWEWSIVSTGDSPVTHITHPWQPDPEYFDPELAHIPSAHINPRCSQRSSTFLTITTMYNGLQKGHEEAYAKVETDAQSVRVVVDFASLADPKPMFDMRPVGVLESFRPGSERQIDVDEPYPLVFTACADDLKKGQILKIRWSTAWR